MTDEKTMDWDSEIENDGGTGFTLLPPGEYRFGIIELTKATSRNLKCPMAKLRIGLYALEDVEFNKQLAEIDENLVLHSTCEWKLCQFFRAIGERKQGQRFKPVWEEVAGAVGRCTVIQDTFTKRDGSEGKNNKIDRFLDPDAAPAPAPAPAVDPIAKARIPF